MNVVQHEIFDHKKWKRKVLLQLLQKKNFRKKLFSSDFFYQQVLKESPILCKGLEELVNSQEIRLENYLSRNGNLSPYEIMVIATLIQDRQAKRILEIGTFDGNTTLQIALNAPEDAIVHTIDLPIGILETKQPVLESDIQFICDETKKLRKFEQSSIKDKIQQHYGDSTTYDFSTFTKNGLLDFIFIDGGHSYECVESDTRNALSVLQSGGCILWHDFTPHFGGVFRFLCNLSKEVPLIHIKGTNLVYYQKEEK